MDSAPNKGNSAGNIPLEEMAPHTRGDLLDTPIHILPLKASPHDLFRVTVVWRWPMGKGRGMRKVYNLATSKLYTININGTPQLADHNKLIKCIYK